MKTIKVWFTDFWPEWQYENFILPILEKHFNVILDMHNPDVLFHSIFGLDSLNYNCKKIAYFAENIRYNYNAEIREIINIVITNANYTIGFEPHNETHFRLPLWQVYILLNPTLKDRLYNRLNYKEDEFERWCAFIISNSGNFLRNNAFNTLNGYKKVHSYGKVFTNDYSLQQITNTGYWRETKDKFFLKHSHKFMITYENSHAPYYCTEKLMDAFLVGAMPIYWGDTKVGEDWNKEAFIDITRNDLDIVKIIDEDWERFRNIYEQPVFTEEQKEKLENNLIEFETWLIEKIK